jgi:SAM-dependent methyltransferase
MTSETGFSAEWLSLREPVDHAATNGRLRQTLVRWLGEPQNLNILDLGSGTGSNLRGLSGDLLAQRQSWRLVDHDARLLRQISHEAVGVDLTTQDRDLSDGDIADLLGDCDLVTASALFDLVSAAVIIKIADQIAERGLAFYTVLTYDGIASWLPEHPLDPEVRAAFNQHQRSDKGFGPAAGPDAPSVLAAAFRDAGFRVTQAPSPWLLDDDFAALRRAVDEGFAAAVKETRAIADRDVDAWLAHRRTATGAVTIVGHRDLLALPSAA